MIPPARLLFWLATGAGIAMVVYSLLHQPPPLGLAVAALVGYTAFIVLGVTFSRFSMFADVVTFGPDNARGVALTFDDGPHPEHTPRILDLLDEADVKATFFVIGYKAERHPELVREICQRGHAVGVHSYRHERLLSLRSPLWVKRDFGRCMNLLTELLGNRPTLFRAPIGHISPTIARVARELGLQAIGWSARGVDGWSGAQPGDVAQRVIRRLRDGAIILLHDAAERDDYAPASIAALPSVLAAMHEKRLAGVRVDAWLRDDVPGAQAAHEEPSGSA